MGVIQPGYLHMHAMCGRTQKHGSTHKQGEASEAGPLGGLASAEDEGGGEQRSQSQIRVQSTHVLQKTCRERSSVRFFPCFL